MWRLASVFVDIALHRRGPDQLPASRFLAGLLLVLDLGVSLLALVAAGLFRAQALPLLLALAFLLAYLFVTLRLFRHEARFAQTASALLGTDVLFTLVDLPFALWTLAVATEPPSLTLPAFLGLLLFFWRIDVSGFVLSRAIGRPYFVGVLFVILYVMASYSIYDLVMPAAS